MSQNLLEVTSQWASTTRRLVVAHSGTHEEVAHGRGLGAFWDGHHSMFSMMDSHEKIRRGSCMAPACLPHWHSLTLGWLTAQTGVLLAPVCRMTARTVKGGFGAWRLQVDNWGTVRGSPEITAMLWVFLLFQIYMLASEPHSNGTEQVMRVDFSPLGLFSL